MGLGPDNPAGPERPGVNDYDRQAKAYTAVNDTGIVNAYCERPAMLELAGDVSGHLILDAGCGSGPLLAALRDRGARVTGLDSSAGMLGEARQRLGADVELLEADLARPLPLADQTFDDVTCSLARCFHGDRVVMN